MSKNMTIKFGSDRRSQAAATHLFDALLGRPPSPTCARCGGITVDEGPLNGRCNCRNTERPNNAYAASGNCSACTAPEGGVVQDGL